jgi:spore coat polysaccharide biosynthesis protein SpsF
MNSAFFVFSRIDSSRLPAKALLKLGDSTLLGQIITSLSSVEGFSPILLTTNRFVDNCLSDYAKDLGCEVFRGSLEDVSSRIVAAIRHFGTERFFRINGDSPCLDNNLIQKGIDIYDSAPNVDFVTNILERSYPYGVAVELFNATFYERHQDNFRSKPEKEHATSYFYKHFKQFNYYELKNELDWTEYRLTIDTLDDYLRFQNILRHCPDFFNLDLSLKIDKLKEIQND